MVELSAERSGGKVLRSVQSLRALAAIGVVVFHASARAGAPLLVGQARVDVFFVISGLIMWMLRDRYHDPRRFLVDRLLRIVPLYWIATLGMFAGGLVHLFPHLILSAPHVAASLFFVPYPSPNSGQLWPLLGQGWTLNYEVFFYLLFAGALLMPRKTHLGLLCGALLLLAGLGAVLHPADAAPHFYTNSIILEFAAGLCIGALAAQRLLPGKGWALAMIAVGALALILQAFVTIQEPRFLIWGLPAALILAGVVALEKAGATFSSPTLLFVGNASYSIYLFHNFAISVVGRFIGASLGFWPEVAISTVTGVAFGIVMHLFVEKPMVSWIKMLRTKPAAPVAAVAQA